MRGRGKRAALRVAAALLTAAGAIASVSCGAGGRALQDAETDAPVIDSPPPSDLSGQACEDALAGQRVVSLDGIWEASLRYREPGDDWEEAASLGEVSVPGWIFPFARFPSSRGGPPLRPPAADRDAQLSYRRDVSWPAAWACAREQAGYRAILEFDSADYHAGVWLDGAQLGSHSGYLGRFGLEWPWARGGALEVRVTDGVRDVEARGGMERYPHTTLQGVDTGGWGVNPVGLPGGLRLRLVRGPYLRAAYAVPAAQTGEGVTIRVGLAFEGGDGAEELRVEARLLSPDGAVLATQVDAIDAIDRAGEASITLQPGTLQPGTLQPAALAPAGVGSPPSEHRVEVSLYAGGHLADRRSVPFVNRRVRLEDGSLTVDGARHFARGGGLHHLYRLLPFDGGFEKGRYIALDAALERRYAAALDQAVRAGVQWLRPGHIVPDARFMALARRRGLVIYQDFPLHWNTDFDALPPDSIAAQFHEFLWRVAAEPAVAAIAAHNEAEIHETRSDELVTSQELLDRLLAEAARMMPHLVAIGCSGCRATARFPFDAAYPVADVIADTHSYLGSWWQPTVGYHEIPARVAALAHPTLPIWWSEMGNGWTVHFGYLAALTDDLEPTTPARAVAARAEVLKWLKAPDGTPLTLRQFYALVHCRQLGIERRDLRGCVVSRAESMSDAELIASARAFFLADRLAVEGDPDDPVSAGALVAAHWLALQIFESRWQWTQSPTGFLGVIPWQRGENAYPFALGSSPIPAATLERCREILAAANAPVAVAADREDDGSLELRVVNDSDARTLGLGLFAGETALWQGSLEVGGAAGAAVEVPATALSGRAGSLAEVRVAAEGEIVATASLAL